MGNEMGFKQAEQQLKEYEVISRNKNVQDTELGYRDMNSRFLQAEKEEMKRKMTGQDQISRITEAHLEKKRQIESAWHQNTTRQVTELKKKAPKKGSEKSANFYQGYSLKELETFLKNNDRGGNSDEFNSVTTDLELYNRVMDTADAREGLKLLLRIQESCEKYISTRKSPISSKGKIRKAIITQVSQKVNTEITSQRQAYINQRTATLNSMKQEASEENVTAAFKSHFDMVFQSLNGSMELDENEMQKLDTDMEQILIELNKQNVEDNQEKNLSTQFFNALGWSSNDPRFVEEKELYPNGKALKNSPHGKPLYHCIQTKEGTKDAVPYAKQLAGVREKGNKVYYGLGRFGKGIYSSARTDSKSSSDELAKHNSWNYGKEKGSIMFTMALNENARLINKTDLFNAEKEIRKKYPKLTKYIIDHCGKSQSVYRDFDTMFAAFLGYNTVLGDSGFYDENGKEVIEYLTTTDRKALSISKTMEIRTRSKKYSDDKHETVELSLEELKNRSDDFQNED
ncbi:MAG: hypothetical protein IKQ49_05530 [Eubacterium sp.]|nr:hypothetical protein [Eubacterium sp.]